MPFDFTIAAEKAMPVVVHISAAESETLAKQRKQQDQQNSDPFRNFFGDDFFFGTPFDMPNLQKKGSGSGVIIDANGYIITNNHVVGFADEVEVTLYDNRTYKAEIIGTDPQTDLAVLKIDETNLPTLSYADSDEARIGEWVLAVGNPFDLTSTVTAGIVSAKGRNINIISNERSIEAFIQTDAAVNPGNSGGALVDAKGQLLGINTAIATQTGSFSGYSFAIPINMARKIVDDIIEYGSYQRAFLGINIMDMDNELAEELNLSITQGVYVDALIDGGAAGDSGIRVSDVIVKVDNRSIKSVPELQEIVGRSKVGDTITLTVIRNGSEKQIPVQLKAG
ncbi:MAG: trypsin-like peptidase domain-containing protein [Bacteroidota bacterium]